jgi:hypothetical protein
MQEMPNPPDAGFVVEWQLAEDAPVLDLATAESEVILPEEAGAGLRLGLGRGQDR